MEWPQLGDGLAAVSDDQRLSLSNPLKVCPEAGLQFARADDIACHVVIVTTSGGGVKYASKRADTGDILPWRDMYRLEMNCQIVHDSIHSRPGWTQEYLLFTGGIPSGYGSIAVAGPWKGKPTVYEFYVLPHHRLHAFGLFRTRVSFPAGTS